MYYNILCLSVIRAVVIIIYLSGCILLHYCKLLHLKDDIIHVNAACMYY